MPVRVAGGQLNLTVGDLAGNEARIAEVMAWAEAEGADVLLLPELAINGYPPEDLVLRRDFVQMGIEARDRLAERSRKMAVVVGFVDFADPMVRGGADAQERTVANAAADPPGRRRCSASITKCCFPTTGCSTRTATSRSGADPDAIWDLGGVVSRSLDL